MSVERGFQRLMRHSHLLRAAMNLAADRSLHLQQTIEELGLDMTTLFEGDNLQVLQVHTARELGGVEARMLLDAPREIMKYHFGPLQVALSLLYAVIERYRQLSREQPLFQDDLFDEYCTANAPFIDRLEIARNSILYEGYGDHAQAQQDFVAQFRFSEEAALEGRLIAGEQAYRDYLRRLTDTLKAAGS